MQAADDWDSGPAAYGASSAEALHVEALRELASVQSAAAAAMAETTDLRRRNESLQAEVKAACFSLRSLRADGRACLEWLVCCRLWQIFVACSFLDMQTGESCLSPSAEAVQFCPDALVSCIKSRPRPLHVVVSSD